MSTSDPIVIIAAKRTPHGKLLGALSLNPAHVLGTQVIQAALDQCGLDPALLSEVLMGCVLPAGQGQAPARQAARGAGIPDHCGATTVNKMCGSGMKTTMLAYDMLLTGQYDFLLAGGMESMSLAPHLLPKARQGYRLGHGELLDHMFLDGLEDAYNPGQLMGVFAEHTAQKYGFTRQQQDDFAVRSVKRTQQANAQGYFNDEIVPVDELSQDEGPQTIKLEKIPQLKPAFAKDGTVTAANSSSIADGASALILTRLSIADKHGFTPLAILHGHSTHAQAPEWFTTAPSYAINNLLAQLDWSLPDVDYFEINEAFAVVTMAAMHDLSLSPDVVNLHGGACAIGHPIGSTGSRIIATLLNVLKQHGGTRGIASLCIGGGEATAVGIELIN